MNIHIYDGKVRDELLYDKDIPILNDTIRNFSNHPCWQIIIEDWGTFKNYDNLNNLRVEPFCKLIAEKLPPELKSVFEEQLQDMLSGLCPQGRAVRLFQMVNSFL